MIWDGSLTNLLSGQDLILQIYRWNVGKTQVAILNDPGDTPIEAGSFQWDQVTSECNSHQPAIPFELLVSQNP